MAKRKNSLVFMDVSIDGDPVERMLFFDVAPKTAENFRALCTGEKGIGPRSGKPLHYKGSFFHRIVKGYVAQGGDFVKRNGTGGESIYGGKFPDEPPRLKHEGAGLLSMPVTDRDTLGSHFIITFTANHNLDRKHVVFGKLVHGHEVLRKIENVGEDNGSQPVTVKIINCGEFDEDKMKVNKLKTGKEASSDANSHEARRKGKHKKSSRDKRRKRRRYYSSESDSSSDSELESSESESDSDSSLSSSSYVSSSSDDRRRKRKRSSKREKYRRGKRKDKRRDKKRRRRDKKSKRRSKRASDSLTDSESESKIESGSENDFVLKGKDQKRKKDPSQKTGQPHTYLGELAEAQVLVEVLLAPLKGAGVSAEVLKGAEVLLELVAVEVQPAVSAEVQRGATGVEVSVGAQNSHRNYSRSPTPVHRVRSPSDRGRSASRSVSPNGTPKRIRRGRGFSQRYSYARRYRTPSRSPVRSYRYGGRSERDRYSSYRRYSPRRYRSPPRGRTPRYRSRRSRTASISPSRWYRGRRYSRSRSPIRSRTRSPVDIPRSRGSSRAEWRRSPPRSRSPSESRSSLDSQSPKRTGKSNRSRSSSGSPVGKKGLVSYGDGSPDSSPG
ncbi:hypothetical protein FNV43_RR12335 [Rhamnella rubrinervis]|uniref:peptidylprolyl isomerase n=1 Tax=Rhamnella rubrinervis TaxID=2594499 RepID=A0A8K0MIS4_9ROSA|nr:hypothetical protein FNV43_RR12335 [Rhamnella rubrinervis]